MEKAWAQGATCLKSVERQQPFAYASYATLTRPLTDSRKTADVKASVAFVDFNPE